MARVSEQAVGEKVLKSLDPDAAARRHRPSGAGRPDGPGRSTRSTSAGDVTVLMLCGLQGSGKTTTCGKLGRLLQQSEAASRCSSRPTCSGPRPSSSCTCSASSSACRSTPSRARKTRSTVCQNARAARPSRSGADVVILDTAGRLHIDEELMDQLARIDRPRAARPGLPGRRRHDRPGRRQQRQGVQRGAGARRRDHDQARRRRPRRRGCCRSRTSPACRSSSSAPASISTRWRSSTPTGMAGRILGMGDMRRPGRAGAAEVRPGGAEGSRRPSCSRASSRSTTSRSQLRQMRSRA